MSLVPTRFLQMVAALIAVSGLGVLIWEPQTEGRNTHATLFDIYFHDPFVAYAYVSSIPFFAAVYQAFRLLGYVEQERAFSTDSVTALRTIRHCATSIICLVALGEVFLLAGDSDDRAGGVFIGIVIAFISTVVVAAAAMLEQILQSGVELKSKQDLSM